MCLKSWKKNHQGPPVEEVKTATYTENPNLIEHPFVGKQKEKRDEHHQLKKVCHKRFTDEQSSDINWWYFYYSPLL